MAVLTFCSLLVVAVLLRPLVTTLFDADFAGAAGLRVRALELRMTARLVVAVVVGLRAVGAILMVAMLVVPTTAARQLTDRFGLMLVLAGVIGASVGVAGSLLAGGGNVPTGPVIVLLGVAVAVACILFAPGRGVLWRARRLARERRRALVDGVLVDLETLLHAGPPPTMEELQLATGRPRRALRRALADLDHARLLAHDDGRVRLSDKGADAAHAALERRRLWTLWLEFGARLELPDAREPDPRDLASSIGGDAVSRLEELAAWSAR
jgi:manganese/zinc/iron transport system permease protein